MYKYEIPKRRGYPKTTFYEDYIVFNYKDGREIAIKANEIDRIDYVKPSLRGYLKASVWLGGTFPGRMEIYLSDCLNSSLLNYPSKKKLYLVKISYKDIIKLPNIYKEKMGYNSY